MVGKRGFGAMVFGVSRIEVYSVEEAEVWEQPEEVEKVEEDEYRDMVMVISCAFGSAPPLRLSHVVRDLRTTILVTTLNAHGAIPIIIAGIMRLLQRLTHRW